MSSSEEGVERARSKLDEILKDLAEQGQSMEEEARLAQEGAGSGSLTMPPPLTPSKRGRTPRKRRKKETPPEPDYGDTSRPSYQVNLFDRSVDLAQFTESTTLYSMCRAWMMNKPYARYQLPDGNNEDAKEPAYSPTSSQEEEDTVVSLPEPTKSETVWSIPRPLPPACKTQRLEDVVNTNNDIVELKKENTNRWRRVKQRWREASKLKQERYVTSLVILKKVYSAS